MLKRKYTIIFHTYVGYGSYCIHVERFKLNTKELRELRLEEPDVHFILKGWPAIIYPDKYKLKEARCN